jgi:undecaprenyl-diphosphatase
MEWLNSIDIQLFQLINGSGYEQIDNMMVLISGKLTWIPLYLLLLYLLYKKFSAKFIWVLISLGVLIFLADYGSVHFFKEVFKRLRPCHQLDNIRIVTECGGLYSFVSSHAANTFAIAFFMGLLFKNIWGFIFLFSWAVIIGFSRVYLGVHFPFDIVGGMFWGLFVSLLVFKLLKLKLNEAV